MICSTQAGLLERIFGSSDDPKPSPTPPPKHMGHLKKKRLAPEPPTKGHDRVIMIVCNANIM